MGKVKLTDRQREILQWIDTQPHNRSSRQEDGSLILGGGEGQICIAWDDNKAIMKMIEPNRDPGFWRQKHFALTKAGRAALAQHERSQTEG